MVRDTRAVFIETLIHIHVVLNYILDILRVMKLSDKVLNWAPIS